MFYLSFDDRPCVHVLSNLHVADALRRDKLGLGDSTFGDRAALADVLSILASRLLCSCHVLLEKIGKKSNVMCVVGW